MVTSNQGTYASRWTIRSQEEQLKQLLQCPPEKNREGYQTNFFLVTFIDRVVVFRIKKSVWRLTSLPPIAGTMISGMRMIEPAMER